MPTKKRKKKRPVKPGSTNPPERRCEIYVRPEQEAALQEIGRLAHKKGISRSQLIFEALESWLKRHRKR